MSIWASETAGSMFFAWVLTVHVFEMLVLLAHILYDNVAEIDIRDVGVSLFV